MRKPFNRSEKSSQGIDQTFKNKRNGRDKNTLKSSKIYIYLPSFSYPFYIYFDDGWTMLKGSEKE